MFTEQQDGLLVLKPAEVNDMTDHKDSNKNIELSQSITHRIHESIMNDMENTGRQRYDVKFQNRALEEVLGIEDIQKNLHTPCLLFGGQS